MKRSFLHLLTSVAAVTLAVFVGGFVFEGEAYAAGSEIGANINFSNGSGSGAVTDEDYDTSVLINSGDSVTITASDGGAFESIYLIWNSPVSEYNIHTDSADLVGGTYGFLHEYIEFDEATGCVTIDGCPGFKLSRVRIFTDKTNIPDDVQKWEPPLEKADILAFSSHSDDEILFFGSAIAKYIYEKNAKVQVAYLTQYWDLLPVREHEKLDGLWCDGVRNYPVCGGFPDQWADGIHQAREIYNEDDLVAYEAAMIRQFKPLIVITHDFNGEYGHGFHRLVAASVATALDDAADPAYDAGLCAGLEAWDTPKAYFHNYEENAISLDLRIPVDERGGLAPIEIAALAYKQHVSQQWCWFYVSDDPNDKHPEINSAAWGLYRTNVGYDTENDFFENLTDFSFEDTRIHISTPEQLLSMREDPTASYILDDDIDMKDVEWTPFSFHGVLNGNGHAILNLHVSALGDAVFTTYDGNFKEYDTKFAGMFDAATGATIKNLTLLGMSADVDAEESCFVGSIAGYTENTRITNCTVDEARITLKVNAPMFGVAGLVGYGCGKVKDCTINTTLVCVDKNADERDEQYMGGVFGAGYLDVDDCNVTVHGYDSDHGYVHNGGVVGMYIFYPNLNIGYKGSLTGISVDGKITFFEDNTNRRAYCEPIFGEVMIWEFDYAGNSETFTRDEVFDYSKDLYPDMCENPNYITEVTVGDCNNFGYTTYTCAECGYSYKADYTLHVHTFDEGAVETEPTLESEGVRVYTCENCGYTREESIPKLEPEPVEEDWEGIEQEPDLLYERTKPDFTPADKKFIVAACVGGAALITLSAFIGIKVSSGYRRNKRNKRNRH